MTEAERKALIQKNLRASKLKWKDLSADIVERVMQGTRRYGSPNFKFKSAINETETERLGRHIYDGFPDDFKNNPTDEALDRLLGETQADIVPKWEKGLDWDSLTGKFAPNKQFELAKAVSFSKSNEQPTSELGKWLKEFNEDRANIPGVYNKKQDQVFRLGGELPPRYTGRDDEPSEEVLTQLRAMNAIKDGNALIDQYNSLRKLSTRLPEGAINPFVRSSSPQSLIGAGGRYSNSPLNRIATLNVPLSNKENDMGDIFNIPWRRNEYDYGKGRYDPNAGNRGERTTELFEASKSPSEYVKFGTTPGGSTPYMDQLNYLRGLENPQPKNPGLSFDGGQTSFYSDDAFMQGFRDATGYGGGDVEGTIRDNIRFDLGDRGDGKGDKTDWLGWAGIGTGLLQGAGGIMDYFANMKGLELTKEAMDRKYAADDRNYLAQATALNNVIDTRKDFIDKTQGGRNTDFLKNIPV